MIALVNERLIPVWINVRASRWPALPAIDDEDWELALTDDRYVGSPFYYFYFVRSYVIAPDRQRLLNASAGRIGHIGNDADDYLAMLRKALGPAVTD